jgi:hypothetical protein
MRRLAVSENVWLPRNQRPAGSLLAGTLPNQMETQDLEKRIEKLEASVVAQTEASARATRKLAELEQWIKELKALAIIDRNVAYYALSLGFYITEKYPTRQTGLSALEMIRRSARGHLDKIKANEKAFNRGS